MGNFREFREELGFPGTGSEPHPFGIVAGSPGLSHQPMQSFFLTISLTEGRSLSVDPLRHVVCEFPVNS
jgi:hypothetical protein